MAAPAHIDELIGSTIGEKYRLERSIGRGGMGAVYEAVHTGIGKRVALKFLDPVAGRDPDSVVRFQREAEAASAVESAHIVEIFDTGETADGRPYLVMELLRGEDLRARLRRLGRLTARDVVHIARQVLRGLARAHAAHIVHRDLKPDNVFLCARDDEPTFVKIVDFGVSKVRQPAKPEVVTSQGTVLGTVFYMAPEQAQASPDIDGRADIYSVGAILFEALTGRPPHQKPSYESLLVSICTEDAPDVRSLSPDVPAAVATAIARALRRDREARFQTAEDFALALDEALNASGEAHREPRSAEKRRQRLLVGVVATIAALGAFAVTAIALRGPKPAEGTGVQPALRAEEPAARESNYVSPTAPRAVSPVPTAPVAAVSASPVAATARAPLASIHRDSARPSSSKPTRPMPSAASPSPSSAPGVAGGLKLNLSEP